MLGDREFRYYPRRWIQGFLVSALLLVSVGAVANIGYDLGLRPFVDWPFSKFAVSRPSWAWEHPWLWRGIDALALLWAGGTLAASILRRRNAAVHTLKTGISFSNLLGRTSTHSWPETTKLAVVSVPLTLVSPAERIEVYHGDDVVQVHWSIERDDELIELIIQRAGLTEKRKTWWGATYTRPPEERC